MSQKIKLVQGDSYPYIRLTLTDPSSGLPVKLDDPDTVVRVYFRASGTDEVLSTIVCEKVSGGATGIVRFNFSNNELDVEPGAYEGEVEVDFGGETQTVYEVLKFTVRSQFA